jgi:BAAT / Acyl-CoA thioester hydrolase C terminal
VDLHVTPADGPVDVAPMLRVDSAAAGDEVTLTMSTTDAAGRRWRSVGVHRVDPDGALQTDDPERPWWDMAPDQDAPADQGTAPVAFTAPDEALDYRLSVSSHRGVADAVVRRTWGAGLTRAEYAGDGWRLRVYRPAGRAGNRPAVLVVPGSTGVAAVAPTAALLATHGYVAGVLAYMQEAGLPASMRSIPTEVLTPGLQALRDTAATAAERVAVLAASVGTVVALGALGCDGAPRVGAVVVVSPTHVVWQAMSVAGRPPKASMLSSAGRDLPFVRIRGEKLLGQMLRNAVTRRLSRRPVSAALRLLPAYAAGLADARAVAAAALPVERVAAPLLAVAGEDDAVWPSAEMGKALLERRRAHGVGRGDRLLLLPGAGHLLRPPITPTTVDRTDALVSGGDPQGTARGQRASWHATLEFLGETVGAP